MQRSLLRRALPLAAGLAVIVLAAFVALRMRSAEGRLALQTARRVGKAPAVSSSSGQVRLFREFYPISGTALLVIGSPVAAPRFCANGSAANPNSLVYRVDLTNGHAVRSEELEESLARGGWAAFNISPDGKKMLCIPSTTQQPGLVVDLVTGAASRTNIAPSAVVGWLSGSTQYFALGGGGVRPNKGRLYRTDSPDFSVVALPPDMQTNGLSDIFSMAIADAEHIALAGAAAGPQTIRSRTFRLSGSSIVAERSLQFNVPEKLLYGDSVRLNARGTRLLWQGRSWSGSSPDYWQFHTANLDGSEQRILGSVAISRTDSDNASGFGAEWMPDGKTVCFLADGEFYLIADR